MTPEIITCLSILVAAIGLFAWDRVPADVVALGAMLALVFTGLLKPEQAFAGFSSDTVMMILGLLIMTAGLVQTGVVESAGRLAFKAAGRGAHTFLPMIVVSVAVVSAFMSNTAATAFFVPLVLGYAAKTQTSPSRYLLPVAFASILTSPVTVISSSSNIVVSDVLTRYQQPPIGMFEMAPVGIPIAVVGIAYLLTLGVRLIPSRADQQATENVGERTYQAEAIVIPGGPLVGKTLDQADLDKSSGLEVVKLARAQRTIQGAKALAGLTLEGDDELVIEGLRADLLKIKDKSGLDLKPDVHLADRDENGKSEDLTIVEGVLLPHSPLIGQTLRSLDFKDRYGLQVLAIHRAGRLPASISATRLRLGDVLLLQGRPENVKALERGNLFNIFGVVETGRLNVTRAPIAGAIFALSVAAATSGLVPLALAVLAGAFLMLATRCLSPEEAYRQVEWKALVLIGALLSLGVAMDTTGAGKFLATQLIAAVGQNNAYGLLTSLFLLTVALTQPMSNQAAAVVVLPIAIATATAIGVNPRPFGMMVAIAASVSYLTPLEPSCLMVYGPGKYQFFDFVRVGLPLTVLIYLVAIVLVPLVWPL